MSPLLKHRTLQKYPPLSLPGPTDSQSPGVNASLAPTSTLKSKPGSEFLRGSHLTWRETRAGTVATVSSLLRLCLPPPDPARPPWPSFNWWYSPSWFPPQGLCPCCFLCLESLHGRPGHLLPSFARLLLPQVTASETGPFRGIACLTFLPALILVCSFVLSVYLREILLPD